jgi:hypothetical protein
MFADDAPPLEWEEGERRYTRSTIEVYYSVGAGKPLAVAEGAPREEHERALAHALHWGWPEEEEEGEKKGKEEDEEEEDAAGPEALARREAGLKKSGSKKGGGKSAPPPRFARLDAETLTLGEALLLPGHVVAGVPVFWVVARGTEYHARWLREAPLA